MNDATRANVFRKPEGANTPEGWSDLREAVKGVRDDLQATNSDKIGHAGKWAVRYPNGDRPANEADCTFMVCARNTVLSLMDKVESLYKDAAERKAEFLQYQEQAVEAIRASKESAAAAVACIEKLKADHAQYIEDLAKTHDGHTANLQSQIDGLQAEVKLLREQPVEVAAVEVPTEAEPKAIKKTPKRKPTVTEVAVAIAAP